MRRGLRIAVFGCALAAWAGAAAAQAPGKRDVWPEFAAPDEEAARAGRQASPFTQEQILLLGELIRQTQQATEQGAGAPPAGRIRRISVDPGAGAAVPVVEVRRGFTTAVSWTDVTGSPWPIEEVHVDAAFLPGGGNEGAAGGHLVYLAPQRRFMSGNLVVKLRDLAEPVAVLLRDSGGAESDFRVEMRLPRPGPGVDAEALMRPASFHAGDGELAGLLAGRVPAGAVDVELEGGGAGDRAWRHGEDLLLVSRHAVLSPGAWAAERGSGGRWAYRLPAAPRVLVTLDGREAWLSIAGSAPAVWGEGREADR